jgi:hypothetical protein
MLAAYAAAVEEKSDESPGTVASLKASSLSFRDASMSRQ